MRTIKAYEFKDLEPGVQGVVKSKVLNDLVDMHLQFLDTDLEQERITEEEYYKELGCSKYYAETTAWFVPSCYYDKHSKELEVEALEVVTEYLYDLTGRIIGTNN